MAFRQEQSDSGEPAARSPLGFSLVSQISRDEVAHLARLAVWR
ncbi:hypothetical protein I545_6816 [Mycobacterium kansasii 662]|uniref:Uncharacterized protein n=1 Tax=Mycobacterium kansasii 662 TaxID=1299326 RepID=X7XR96_MYCKA|nr:hypothetical protein I545_6816 [Mycobacterium kansasii 662]